jgi:glycosyltransferase
MKISIITPTYNSENTILRNAKTIISQTYKDFEHIIVDNLSKDNTLQLVTDIYKDAGLSEKLKIISEKDTGISDAFNKGIHASIGDVIAILNSDDSYYHEDVFSQVVSELNNDHILFVHGDIYFVDQKFGSNIRHPLPNKVMSGCVFNHQTMFIKRAVYNKVGLYNTEFLQSMDFEFYCRIIKHYDIAKISVYLSEKPLVRMHAGGISWRNEFVSIEEEKKALMLNGFWNNQGKKFYYSRKLRAHLKVFFNAIGFQFIVKLWRKLKWKN